MDSECDGTQHFKRCRYRYFFGTKFFRYWFRVFFPIQNFTDIGSDTLFFTKEISRTSLLKHLVKILRFFLHHFGHTRNGNVTGSAEEVFNRVKHQRNNTQFLRKVYQTLDNGTGVNVDTVDLKMDISSPYFPDNVLNIHLSGLEHIQRTEILALGFEQLQNHSVKHLELRLLDSSLLTSRPLNSLGQFYGDSVVFEPGVKSSHIYTVILEQTKYLEEDVSKNCVNYPTENHKSYQHCDDLFQKEFLEKHTPSKQSCEMSILLHGAKPSN